MGKRGKPERARDQYVPDLGRWMLIEEIIDNQSPTPIKSHPNRTNSSSRRFKAAILGSGNDDKARDVKASPIRLIEHKDSRFRFRLDLSGSSMFQTL
jgi:hypothetical protein